MYSVICVITYICVIYGVMSCDTVLCCMVWYDIVFCGVILDGMVLCDMMLCDMVFYGVVVCGVVWY